MQACHQRPLRGEQGLETQKQEENHENVIIDGRSILPQIRGEQGTPREWAFCHYDPMVPFAFFQENAGRWARDQRFKLYHDGRFFDVGRDPLEGNDLTGEATAEEKAVRQSLARVHLEMPPWEERGAGYRRSTKAESRRFTTFINQR